jgi:COP9 signalosome complex subunit 2
MTSKVSRDESSTSINSILDNIPNELKNH